VGRLVSGNEPRALPPKDSSERTQAGMIEICLSADRHGSAPGAPAGPEKNPGSSPENRPANARAGERKRKGDTNKSDIVRPKPPGRPDLRSAPRPEPASTAWYGIALHYLLPSHRPVSSGGISKKIMLSGPQCARRFLKGVISAGQPIGRSNSRSFFSPALKLEPLNPCIGDSNA